MLEPDAHKHNLNNDKTEPYNVPQSERNLDQDQPYREFAQPPRPTGAQPLTPPTQSTGAHSPVPPSQFTGPQPVYAGNVQPPQPMNAQHGTGAYRPVPPSAYGSPDVQPGPYRPLPQPGAPNAYYQQGQRGMTQPDNNLPPQTPPNGGPNAGRPQRKGLRTGAIFLLTLLLALVFGTGLFAGWQFGRTSTPAAYVPNGLQQSQNNSQATVPALSGNNIQAVRESVIAKVRPAVVQINVTTQRGSSLGSGVIIDKRGYIVTNNHVVDGARSIEVVLYDGTRVRSAKVVGTDPADDLAVVQINPTPNMVVLTLADSSKAKVGQEVLAIGNPLGNTQTVTQGIISALGRNVSEGNGAIIPNTIQTDAPINPGNSGGALVDLQGNLLGIPTLTAIDPEFNAPANGVGFAIPSNRVAFIVPQLINDGKVQHTGRAAIGIRMVEVDASVQSQANLSLDHGLLITEIVSGGAAEKAGMRSGDVITQIDNKVVNTRSELSDALLSKNVGDQVTIKAQRGSQQMTFTVKLGELQSE